MSNPEGDLRESFEVVPLASLYKINEATLKEQDDTLLDTYKAEVEEQHTRYVSPKGTPEKPFKAIDSYPILKLRDPSNRIFKAIDGKTKSEPERRPGPVRTIDLKKNHEDSHVRAGVYNEFCSYCTGSTYVAPAKPEAVETSELILYALEEFIPSLPYEDAEVLADKIDQLQTRDEAFSILLDFAGTYLDTHPKIINKHNSGALAGMTDAQANARRAELSAHQHHHLKTHRYSLSCGPCQEMLAEDPFIVHYWHNMVDFAMVSFNASARDPDPTKRAGKKWYVSLGVIHKIERPWARWKSSMMLRGCSPRTPIPDEDCYIPHDERQRELIAQFEGRIERWRRTGSAV